MPNPTASKAGERPLQRQAPGASRDAAEVTAPASPWASVLFLQRAAGNRAVSSILERRPRDVGSPTGAVLRRRCKECDEEDKEKEGHVIRRSAAPGAAASGSGSGDGGGGQDQPSGDAGGSAPSALHSYLSRSMPGGTALDASVRAPLESSFGHDFNQVRIHTDAAAARAAESVDAHAFTLGNSIWFGRGQYRPDTPTGHYLLAHELAHTIQQRGQTPGLQRQLVIGSTTDPAEASADRAALAVTHGGAVPSVGSSTSIVRRRKLQAIEPSGNPDQRIITMDDKAKYRVTRHRRLVPVTSTQGTRTRVSPGADKDNVWIQIEWCKGETRGQIRLRADIPKQTQDLLKKIVTVIQSGGSGNDLLRELQGAEITPSATFDITQSKTWQLVGSIKLTVNRGGAKSGGGDLKLKTPSGTFGVSAEGGSSGGSVIGTFEVPLPGEPKEVKCRVEKTELKVESTYTCELEKTTPPGTKKEKRPVAVPYERSRYIYFHFEQDRIEEGRTAPELAALQGDIAEDFKVARIEGFTSPEGPMAKRGRFRGNDQLAKDRAEAAFKRVQKTCSTASGCFVGEDAATSRTGGGELYTKVRPLEEGGQEVEGRDLAKHAVGKFEEIPPSDTPDPEKRHREDPKIAAELERRRTPESKAEVVYPLLRRAVVTLTKTAIEQKEFDVPTPAKTGFEPAQCPEDVVNEARANFGATDFSKP